MKQCYFCNFEDPRLLLSLDHTLLNQIITIARQKTPEEKPCYFFFDEIQHVQSWEKWLHIQLERPKNNYYILTGSHSCLLSGKFATALTGRHITLKLFPFSFSEFKNLFSKKNLEDYLKIGGFPRVLIFEKPHQLLQEYFNDIILRDVLNQVHSRTPNSIKQVVKMHLTSWDSDLNYFL